MLTPPGLSTAGGSQVPSTTVLSTPTRQGPPSRMSPILPSRSSSTWRAAVGDGRVDALADGARQRRPGQPDQRPRQRRRRHAHAEVGQPRRHLGRQPRRRGLGSRIVSGPGQNRSMSGP